MKEIVGNLFNYNTIVIPTNGSLRSNGRAVMGRGLALEAKKRFKDIDRKLGQLLQYFNKNQVCVPFNNEDTTIFTFPTKHNWNDKKADIKLIERSANELSNIVSTFEINEVYLPCVGCGEGKLNWETEVKPILNEILDDRFIVVKKCLMHRELS